MSTVKEVLRQETDELRERIGRINTLRYLLPPKVLESEFKFTLMTSRWGVIEGEDLSWVDGELKMWNWEARQDRWAFELGHAQKTLWLKFDGEFYNIELHWLCPTCAERRESQ